MILTFDNSIIERFGTPPKRALDKVYEIVIHHTAGDGTWNGLKKWILSPNCERKDIFKKFIGLTHYYIEKNGTIYQPYSLDTWTYHSCSGKHDKDTIGIELVHAKGDFPESQYAALVDLITEIFKQCPIKQIVSHDWNYQTYSRKTKGCPSDWFNWIKLQTMLEERGFKPALKYLGGNK